MKQMLTTLYNQNELNLHFLIKNNSFYYFCVKDAGCQWCSAVTSIVTLQTSKLGYFNVVVMKSFLWTVQFFMLQQIDTASKFLFAFEAAQSS